MREVVIASSVRTAIGKANKGALRTTRPDDMTAERLATRFNITREMADEFSLNSHRKALAAIQTGKFEDEIVPVPVSFTTPNGSKPKRIDITFKIDEGPRAETSMEALTALKPA